MEFATTGPLVYTYCFLDLSNADVSNHYLSDVFPIHKQERERISATYVPSYRNFVANKYNKPVNINRHSRMSFGCQDGDETKEKAETRRSAEVATVTSGGKYKVVETGWNGEIATSIASHGDLASGPDEGSLSQPKVQSESVEARRGDMYYFCTATVKNKNLLYFSNVFPGDRNAPAVAQQQFGQHIADKINLPVSSGCGGDVQFTEVAAMKRRQYYIDNAPKSMATSEKVFVEDWTFTGRPTAAESQLVSTQMMKTDGTIYPSGSGGKVAEDAAIQSTPLYKSLVGAEPMNVVSICQHNEMMNSFYNCACTAEIIGSERQKVGGTIGRSASGKEALHPTTSDLIGQSNLTKCMHVDGAKAYFYKRSMDSTYNIPLERRKALAACTSDRLVAEIQEKPTTDMSAVDHMFSNALTGCNTGLR
jgi:hypothetical protein